MDQDAMYIDIGRANYTRKENLLLEDGTAAAGGGEEGDGDGDSSGEESDSDDEVRKARFYFSFLFLSIAEIFRFVIGSFGRL